MTHKVLHIMLGTKQPTTRQQTNTKSIVCSIFQQPTEADEPRDIPLCNHQKLTSQEISPHMQPSAQHYKK